MIMIDYAPKKEYTSEYWKEEFKKLFEIYPEIKITDLKAINPMFKLAEYVTAFQNIKKGKTSVEKGSVIVETFREVIEKRQVNHEPDFEKINNRQKLVMAQA